ncbi:MAG: glycosyltransferase family 39 protein [Bacteroidota bacterium]
MESPFKSTRGNFLLFLLLIITLWRLGLGQLYLFDWDEINFAEIAREMRISGNWGQPTVGFLPFHEKPPLFSWLQAFAMGWTEQSDLGARLPNLLCGLLSLALLFRIGSRLKGQLFGWLWAAFMGLSILPSLYFRSGIIDPWFNLFLLLAADRIVVWELRSRKTWALLSWAGLWLGLAILTKGPAGGLILALFIGLQLWRDQGRYWYRYLLVGLIGLLPILLWLLWLWPQDDGFFTREFLRYQWRLFSQPDAGHGGFPGYHFVVLLFGCFPASIFALPALFRKSAGGIGPAVHYDRRMRDLFWVVLILFSIVSTKIVHYSSLCYFPLTYLAARTALSWFNGHWKPTRNWWRLLIACWSLFMILALALPLLAQTIPVWKDWFGDELGHWLEVEQNWPWICYLPGLIALGLFIRLLLLAKKNAPTASISSSLIGTALFLYLGLALFAGRIQNYSQGPLVSFYQQQSKKEVYFGTAYHKSYAPIYYGRLRQQRGGKQRDWLFHGPIDADLYFSSPRRKREQVLREVPDAELLYEAGAYAFYRRPMRLKQ